MTASKKRYYRGFAETGSKNRHTSNEKFERFICNRIKMNKAQVVNLAIANFNSDIQGESAKWERAS